MHKRQNMQAFLDTLVGVPQVLQDSAEDKKMVVRFKATQANVVNDNLFLYPRNILQDAINESNELINQNRMIGETPHPRHFTGRNGQVVFDAKVENSVTKIINQFMDETGTVFVDAEVLDTAKGQDLKALIKAGVPVGISLRAIGDSVKKPIGGRMVNVATKLHIRAYDPVMNPATAGCEAVQVLTDAQVEEAMKDAVQITCPCCPDCNCQMEAKDPDQDGDTDFYFCPSCKDVYVPDEQKSMTMTATQTLRKLPNDPDYDGYQLARQFKMDMAKIVVKDNMQKGDDLMNKFISMTLEQLKAWKTTNPGHADMAVCDSMIELKEQAAKSQALTDEIQRIKQKEEVERKKEEARKVLTDAVNALPYEQHVKEGLLQKGAVITDSAEVASFIETEKAFIDSIAVKSKLNDLGVPQNGRAQTIDPSVVVVGQGQPWKPIVDNLQTALDDQMRSMDRNFRPDNALRGANMAILDRIMAKLDRENSPEYRELMKGLTDSAQSIENGVITDSALSTTGDFAQVAAISMAFMRQVWQDLKFAQLVMAEAYGGDTYRIPVEFQSHDLYTQDDFVTGEFDGITTEGVSTFFLEFGGEWLKRGTVISKEAQIQLQKGPFNYDVVARNLANLAMRFQRIIDQKMSLEMLHTSD
ncbi:MAG TPA: hypothetical protein VJ824_13070, partial [Bacillota bacterium]|nr:hypothetical protein [Bacillota bacterium]